MEQRRVSVVHIALLVGVFVAGSERLSGQPCGSWQAVSPPPTPTLWPNVFFNSFLFYAFGRWSGGTTVLVSPDGSSWSALGNETGTGGWPFFPALWGGGQFVGLGPEAQIATSPDMLTWTIRKGPPGNRPEASYLTGIAWDGTTYVAVGFYPQESSGAFGLPWVVTSRDLTTWNELIPPGGPSELVREELDGITWTGSQFVAVGGGCASSCYTFVLTSPDGRTWSRSNGPGGNAIAWNGIQFVVTSASGPCCSPSPAIWHSPDGVNWAQTILPGTARLAGLTWDGVRFVVVGSAGAIFTSRDGVAWQPEASGTTTDLDAVAGNAGVAVALGTPSTILRSACQATGPRSYLPSLAHLDGLNGSRWRSDLEVFNPGPGQAAYAIELLARDQDNSAPPSRPFSLDAGKAIRYTDVLSGLFGFSGAATVRLTPFGGTLLASARTYDDTSGGTYGQGIDGVEEAQALAFGQDGRLIGLSQSADPTTGFRTNLGLVSAGATPITVQVELHLADGTPLGTLSYDLRPYESIQRNGIFGETTSADVPDGYAIVRTTTPGGRFFAYASVIDNRTNDPVYRPAR